MFLAPWRLLSRALSRYRWRLWLAAHFVGVLRQVCVLPIAPLQSPCVVGEQHFTSVGRALGVAAVLRLVAVLVFAVTALAVAVRMVVPSWSFVVALVVALVAAVWRRWHSRCSRQMVVANRLGWLGSRFESFLVEVAVHGELSVNERAPTSSGRRWFLLLS